MKLRLSVASGAFLLGICFNWTSAQDPRGPLPQPVGPIISLVEAIRRAEVSSAAYGTTLAESEALALERYSARAALLPTAGYHNQVIYTQPNQHPPQKGLNAGASTPIFIANNAIREYASQGVFNETVGIQQFGTIRQADARAARVMAEAEIARRGLIATVVNIYHIYGSQQSKAGSAQRAFDEANKFLRITEQREAAREAAHADVLKARLQQQQRDRERADAQLSLSRARLELGVLLFPDPATPFQTEAVTSENLPGRAEVESAARENNPDLRSAFASLKMSEADTYVARAAFLPELGLNVVYGIDAPQFAVNGSGGYGGIRNLGYSGAVTFDIPVWDWLITEHKLEESVIRREAAKMVLTAAQRRLLANLTEFYSEASESQKQITSLDTSVRGARESLRLSNLRYINGESTVLEVVDAQNTLTSAEIAQADGMLRYQVALAQLQALTGRL